MCRTTDYYHRQDRFLRLKAISLQLSLSSSAAGAGVSLLPESLTLVFLPRINGGLLEINGSKIRPDSPAFITLHRVLNSDFIFTSKDRVRACDGVVFKIHLAGNRLLHGGFRQYDDGEFKMECKFMEEEREFGVKEAEIFVVSENGGVRREKAVARRRRRRRYCRKFEVALDEIPEERECDVVEDEEEVCCCCCDEDESESDGGDEVEFDRMVEEEIEGVRWAVDVGIWVVCLGVGFLVSKASTRNLRRRKVLL